MAGPPVAGSFSIKGASPLHLSIYRWSGGPFASSLSLASGTMTRFDVAGSFVIQILSLRRPTVRRSPTVASHNVAMNAREGMKST